MRPLTTESATVLAVSPCQSVPCAITLSHVATRPDPPAAQIDSVSKGIIEQLQKDGRMPYAAIGKAVGLSEAAVRQRVQRLLDNGVMQIVAVTDPVQMGFARQAMIGIHAEGDLDPIAEKLSHMSEVDYVILTAGSFDVMVEVVCESDDHLLELLSKRIRAIPGVRGIESFVYLRLHKQTYSWGVR
jgi:Lrp/AsnC family transcriptional regulator, regulator for asnA, asnC and gidA